MNPAVNIKNPIVLSHDTYLKVTLKRGKNEYSSVNTIQLIRLVNNFGPTFPKWPDVSLQDCLIFPVEQVFFALSGVFGREEAGRGKLYCRLTTFISKDKWTTYKSMARGLLTLFTL